MSDSYTKRFEGPFAPDTEVTVTGGIKKDLIGKNGIVKEIGKNNPKIRYVAVEDVPIRLPFLVSELTEKK